MEARAHIDQLYRQHGPMVLRRAQRILGNETEAQEVLQELFTSFLQRPAQLPEPPVKTAWVYSATTHACLNRIRNRKNRSRILEIKVAPSQSATQKPGSDGALWVQQLLARLPEDQAQAVVHYYFDEMSQEEIAEILGCSRRHVGNLLEKVQEVLNRMEGTR